MNRAVWVCARTPCLKIGKYRLSNAFPISTAAGGSMASAPEDFLLPNEQRLQKGAMYL